MKPAMVSIKYTLGYIESLARRKFTIAARYDHQGRKAAMPTETGEHVNWKREEKFNQTRSQDQNLAHLN
jgi:hypothetical protein